MNNQVDVVAGTLSIHASGTVGIIAVTIIVIVVVIDIRQRKLTSLVKTWVARIRGP